MEGRMSRSLKRFWRASRLALLALGLASIAVLADKVSWRRPPPRSVGELVDRQRASGMQLRVVAAAQSTQHLDDGAFLCERDCPLEELSRLRRAAESHADWVGVVYAQRWRRDDVAVGFINGEWQGCSAWVGDVLLFGDPDLLRRIVTAVER
jgi:hypothetical protein